LAKSKVQDSSYIDNNMLFGVYKGEYLGLSLNNKKVNRSANVLVIGGTGTGKTFKYIKPNILQENCSMVVTDPSGDIFRSFAPYLLSKGYNVFLFNASDFTLSNNYNPLENVFDSYGNISETQVNILVDLYMKNAKAGKEAGGGDPFWDKSEKAFMTALIYYVLEEDEDLLLDGFPCEGIKGGRTQRLNGGRCFSTILKLVQEAKVSDDGKTKSPLTCRLDDFFKRFPNNKTQLYYKTFLIAPQKTANTILITTAVDLQIFSTYEVDMITRTNKKYKNMNINIDKMATQQSYLFLGIPQSHQAFNFLIAMLYSQLYGRLYELGERKLRGKWHIGYRVGTPVFDYFDSEEEAKMFYETVTEDNIVEEAYVNNTSIYHIAFNSPEKDASGKRKGMKYYKSSVLREPLETLIKDMDKMYIWAGDEFAGGDPSLPIHINFLLDEFKNIGEIPNFLTILSTSRKYRIGSHVVIQDIGQLKTMYKDREHETVLANVDTTIFLGSILKEDKEQIQKMLGKTTIRQKSTSSSQSGVSTSYTPTEVDLMSIDEIGAINDPAKNRDDEIVIIRDVTPYVCRKLLLTEHRRWKDVQAVKKKKINAELYYRNLNTDEEKDVTGIMPTT
jgi:type IV secretion system protein VirD4